MPGGSVIRSFALTAASPVAALLIAALFAPACAAAIDIEFSFTPPVDMAEQIVSSLAEGHRAEVHYEIRAYRQNRGLARIFGDRLVAETMVVYQARWDELNDRYIVLIDGTREIAFDGADELTGFLLSLTRHRVSIDEPGMDGIYLLCRTQIEPIRLVPPLTLLTFLMPGFTTTTPWEEIPYSQVGS